MKQATKVRPARFHAGANARQAHAAERLPQDDRPVVPRLM
jgi:hypothetical protein